MFYDNKNSSNTLSSRLACFDQLLNMGNTACVAKLFKDSDKNVARQKRRSGGKVLPKREVQASPCREYPMESYNVGVWGNGDHVVPSAVCGLDRLKNPNLNKGMAYTIPERMALGIHGLLPPKVKTQEEQVEHSKQCLDRLDDNLNKYIFLVGLLDRNEKVFYSLMKKYTAEMLPLVYTPTVGLACQKFGLVYRRPRGMFITIHDQGHIYDVLKNWPEHDVRAIVVTDGERILGLGDLGACGMGIPVGKLALYTALAGVKPHQCLPITLDVGTENKTMLEDPLYIGLNMNRVRGQKYDDFLDEFMEAAVRRFGQNTLIQFEDFGNRNAFRLLQKYRDHYCTFNDDIQGTASVALAGVYSALKITKKKMSDNVFLFWGAGEANLGIANLCMMSMVQEGMSPDEAKKKIWMVDSKGLIVKDRPSGGIDGHKIHFAQSHAPIKDLQEIVDTIQPNILIGAAAQAGAFTPDILKSMAKINERPIIFALSNPTHKAECTALECYTHTDGKAIFASGSPFDPVHYKGKEFITGQGNNSYIFPGVSLAVICVAMRTIPEDVFIIAAKALADIVREEDLNTGSVYPPLTKIVECSIQIAVKVCEYAYEKNVATVHPKPTDMEKYIRLQMYNTDYEPAVPAIYEFPL